MGGSVRINSDGAGGQKAQRAYTISTANFSIYCRIKFPVVGSTWAVPWDITSASNNIALVMDGGTPNMSFDNNGTLGVIFTPPVANVWYDFFVRRNGANADIYYKLASAGSWTGPVSNAAGTLTPTQFTLGDYQGSSSLCNRATYYAKVVIFDTTVSVATGQAEANLRALQASSNVWFYNGCSSAAAFGTDGGGAGNNFTVTGTPVDDTDDPWFGVGAVGVPVAPVVSAVMSRC